MQCNAFAIYGSKQIPISMRIYSMNVLKRIYFPDFIQKLKFAIANRNLKIFKTKIKSDLFRKS